MGGLVSYTLVRAFFAYKVTVDTDWAEISRTAHQNAEV